MKHKKIIIMGAGPAGLATGLELIKSNQSVEFFENEDRIGGLCATFDYKGFKYDFGGHRFFTKQDEVQKIWEEVIGNDFLVRNRLSRIYYRKKFFDYPIKFGNVLKQLGLIESMLVGFSLIRVRIARIFKHKEEVTFEDWTVNRFGRRLFDHFFKSYTEKLWGISVKELGADWAAQRMKDISLLQVLKSLIVRPGSGKVKSWIDEFNYPKYGPGMLYDKMGKTIEDKGGKINLNQFIKHIVHKNGLVEKIIIINKNGEENEISADNYVSSIPLNIMLRSLLPAPPEDILKLVNKMRFRAFFDVCLIVNKKEMFPDNWIYVHEPDVHLLRVQNFKNWSPFMSPDDDKTNIGAEYVCWENDELWSMPDEKLVELAKKELSQVGLVDSSLVESGMVIRNKYAYPVYHLDYKKDLNKIFKYLSQFKNFQAIGRSGLYRYNNMDHSILTGLYAARNIMGGNYDVLNVNADEEYHEVKKND